MADIRRLDERTVERIAAGEVVERPASVVKELVENALDADASRLTVAVENGGIDGIRVTDDGVGMAPEAVALAVEEHTTSKISDIDDLESGVRTLGFRGEALHAIGAVSRLTVRTRPRDGDRGTELRVEGGEVTKQGPAGVPEGTTVAVEDLFFNVPARRKYLKQPSTELDHVSRVVTGYALANPDVAVTLEADGRERFATAGRGQLRETVMNVYGREVATAMIPLEATPDGPLDDIAGLVSHPETNRSGSEYVSTFVNDRWVTASAVRSAVVDAYGTQLAPDRYPFAVVRLDVDPGTVDVNVHPRKLEVRFADEAAVREQVTEAVETALLREGLVRSSAPRGRSAPEQTAVAPERDGEGRESDPRGYRGDDGGETGRDDTVRDERTPDTPGAGMPADPRSTRNRRSTGTGDTRPETGGQSEDAGSVGDSGATSDAATESTGGSGPATEGTDSAVDRRDPHRHRDSEADGRRFRGTAQTRLTDEAPEPEYDRLPAMRILGQLHDTYIVAETDDGLVLVDQHAADERVNYERLQRAFADDVTTQALAQPVEVELTAREASLFEPYADALARLGFRATLVDDRTAEVRTVPGLLADAVGPELVRDLLTAFVAGDGARTVEEAADRLLADLACYPSVTGNVSLHEGRVVDLLDRLDDCENPYACPHGRPTVVELSGEEIETRFERDYPGHAGRRD